MKFIKEFKEFAMRGNVIDLAVGVVVGTAFNKIVTSLVNDVIMPPVGAILGGVNFSQLKWSLYGDTTLNYGAFLQTVVDFLIIALTVFMVIKGFNRIRRKEDKQDDKKPVEPKEEVVLLREIRDSLKKA